MVRSNMKRDYCYFYRVANSQMFQNVLVIAVLTQASIGALIVQEYSMPLYHSTTVEYSRIFHAIVSLYHCGIFSNISCHCISQLLCNILKYSMPLYHSTTVEYSKIFHAIVSFYHCAIFSNISCRCSKISDAIVSFILLPRLCIWLGGECCHWFPKWLPPGGNTEFRGHVTTGDLNISPTSFGLS